MNVTIDVEKGTTDLKKDEVDQMFTFGAQNLQTNQFLQKATDKGTAGGIRKFKPFEIEELSTRIGDESDPIK